MEALIQAIAHSRGKDGTRQTLQEHLSNVATLAAGYASAWGGQDAATFLGLTHDLGKMKATWQERILDLEAWDDAGKPPAGKPVFVEMKHDHKMSSAAYVMQKYHADALALLVAGHHGGIPDFNKFITEMESGKWDASRDEVINLCQTHGFVMGKKQPVSSDGICDYFALMMLYSCLVDADCVDTSAHHEGRLVGTFDTMDALFDKLLLLQVDSDASAAVNKMRQDVREACIFKAPAPKGFFNLHAPTGSGKTISGGLFATSHAVFNSLDRIIYVAPYRTIIDQTAEIYAGVFGDSNVLAHHSTSDLWHGTGEQEKLQRQTAENWEGVPVVVTTSEQFFESLFSGRPGAARKVHNIANSMIVIDEPQALPARLLIPCMAALKAMVNQFGCSVLFMSATVPPLETLLDTHAVQLLDGTFKAAQRVTVDIEKFSDSKWSDLSTFMATTKQSLAIANTKAGALRIFKGLPMVSRTYLSTWLCPAHRKVVINGVKAKLKTGKACHVASTQVIEAGVDLDFPDTLLREKAPLDSLLQAFGRCNRHGKGHGQCFVFSPIEGNQLTDYDKAISIVNHLLYVKKMDAFDAATLEKYYTMLYAISNLDGLDIIKHVTALNFETVRDGNEEGDEGGFRLIADGQVHLICEYGTADQKHGLQDAIAAIKSKVADDDIPPRWATRRLQNFVVSVYPRTFEKLDAVSDIEPLFLNYHVWKGDYSDQTGLGDVIDSLSATSDGD